MAEGSNTMTPAMKVRVHELAKQLNTTSAKVLEVCRELGIAASTASSGLDPVRVEQIRDVLVPAEAPRAVPVAPVLSPPAPPTGGWGPPPGVPVPPPAGARSSGWTPPRADKKKGRRLKWVALGAAGLMSL